MADEVPRDNAADVGIQPLQRRHLLAGWLGLLIFLTLGIVLEAFHGFKTGYYLDANNSARRLMWTLCHVHGTLFSLIQVAFACTLGLLANVPAGSLRFVSRCLIGALVLMPLGFFLGGLQTYGGDPGLGVLIVPVGALLQLIAVWIFLLIVVRSGGRGPGPAAADDHATPGQLRPGRKKRRK